jgi:hypothetical protein
MNMHVQADVRCQTIPADIVLLYILKLPSIQPSYTAQTHESKQRPGTVPLQFFVLVFTN